MVLLAACKGHSGGTQVLSAGQSFKNSGSGSLRVSLPDGSQVLLLPGTEVSLDQGFGGKNRNVQLDGVAVFTAKPEGGQSFIVLTRNLQITVLGTVFRVDAFRKNAGEEVDVLEGKVHVVKAYHSDTDNAPEDLNGGEMVMINRDIDLMEKEKMNAEELEKVKAIK